MESVNLLIHDCCVSNSSFSSKVCEDISKDTYENISVPQIIVGKLEASFLNFLVMGVGANRIFEIGTYTGYSALDLASSLPENGELITLDISEETIAIAKKFWKKSHHDEKIKAIVGPALESLETISGKFDFIFIEAYKTNYLNYFKKALTLLSDNEMIAIDNCLWGGQVCDIECIEIRDVSNYIRSRDDLISSMLPIRIGIQLVQKIKF